MMQSEELISAARHGCEQRGIDDGLVVAVLNAEPTLVETLADAVGLVVDRLLEAQAFFELPYSARWVRDGAREALGQQVALLKDWSFVLRPRRP